MMCSSVALRYKLKDFKEPRRHNFFRELTVFKFMKQIVFLFELDNMK